MWFAVENKADKASTEWFYSCCVACSTELELVRSHCANVLVSYIQRTIHSACKESAEGQEYVTSREEVRRSLGWCVCDFKNR